MLGKSYQLVILLKDIPVRRAQDGLGLAVLVPHVAADDDAVEGAACLPVRQPIDFLEAAKVERTGALGLLHDAAVHACHAWLQPMRQIQPPDLDLLDSLVCLCFCFI